MRKGTFVVVMLAVVVLSGGLAVQLAAADPDPGAKQIRWYDDLDAAHQVSLQANKPMLLVISADWCRYCRKFSRNTLADRDVVEYVNASFVPVQLDLDKNKRVAKILGIRSIPCSVVLSPRADLLGKITGHAEPSQYGKTLRAAHRLQQRIEQAGLTVRSSTP